MAKNVTGADIFGGMFQNISAYESDKSKNMDHSSRNGDTDGKSEADIITVNRELLHPFHSFYGHPFRVTEDFAMQELADSIRDFGIMEPVLVRPDKEKKGEYEIISGHRRTYAAGMAGIMEMPVRIMDLSDREAAELMVDSNNKRENILPSEKAWAYRTKAEAARQQGKRTDLQIDTEEDMENETAGGMKSVGDGDSVRTVRRYIRLTYLIKELLDLVDEKKMSLGTGYIISFFNSSEQECIMTYYMEHAVLPGNVQLAELMEWHKKGQMDQSVVEDVMSKEKSRKTAGVKKEITIKRKNVEKYFPPEATDEDMESVIMELLEKWAAAERAG